MSFERLLELARSLPREEFAKSFTRWFLIILDTGEEEPPSSFETMDVSAPRALLAARPAGPLVHEIAKAEGNPYPDRISIGRARNCDIVLRYPTVSKLHAHFLPRPGAELEIVDVGSQVGTRVNGRSIEPNRPHRVAPGFILSIGRMIVKVVDARAAWELLRAQEQVDHGSIPPRSSVLPGSVPGLRSGMPSSAPAPRPSVPGSSSPPSSAERSGIRRAEPDAEPGASARIPGSTGTMRRG
jgi:hypothetical protein